MIKNRYYFFILPLLFFYATSFCQRNAPIFQLNHVDIAVDSTTFDNIIKNDFLKEAFAFVKIVSEGSEILILGKESFIHLLKDQGFYKNRLGACVPVHHSFKWQETADIQYYLQSFTKDSLYNRPYNSPELTIDYINVFENLQDTTNLLKFIPILQNFSKKDYFSFGYTETDLTKGITQLKYMQDYVGKETKGKLFKNIKTIRTTATPNEMRRMTSLLHAYGYKRRGNKFILNNNPLIQLFPGKNNFRDVRIKMSLSKRQKKQTIRISNNCKIDIQKHTAVFNYSFNPDLFP